MSQENGENFNPDNYRLGTEAKNRNTQRNWRDKLLGRNKTTTGDITAEEAGYTPEEKLQAYSRTFEVSDRLREAKKKNVSEVEIAHERASVDDEKYDLEVAQSKSDADHAEKQKAISESLKQHRLDEIRKELSEKKQKISGTQDALRQLSHLIRDQREIVAYKTSEAAMPQAKALLESYESQQRKAGIDIDVWTQEISRLEAEKAKITE